MVKQSGSVLMIIVVLLMIIASLVSGFIAMTLSTNKSSSAVLSTNNSYDLAMAGIEDGSYQLTLGSCSASWSATVSVPNIGEYRYNCNNYSASRTTNSALTNTATSIPLTSVAGLATFGAITIESETVYYNGISGLTLINARRGQNGTTAAAHASGVAAVQSQYVITAEGAFPKISAPEGKVTLSQSVLLVSGASYFSSGSNGSNGVILSYNGSSWSTVLSGPSGFIFQDLFTSTTYGQAVGFNASGDSSIYQYNGSSWSLLTATISQRRLYSVGCDIPSNPAVCWAGGQRVSPNRGIWYRNGLIYQASGSGINFIMSGVSCYGGVCMTVGNNHTYRYNSTSVPAVGSPVNISATLNDVDCPASNRCLALRNDGTVYYHNGTSWSSGRSSATNMNAVYCPSTSLCFVVGNSGRIYRCTLPLAANCTVQVSPGSLNLNAIHCNSTTDCLAVSSTSGTTAYRLSGSAWTAITLPSSYSLNGVSGVTGGGGATYLLPTVLIQQ